MLNRSASLAMSTSVLKALLGKLDIKRHSPSILNLPDVHGYMPLPYYSLPNTFKTRHVSNQMDYPIHIDTSCMKWSILYFVGNQSKFLLKDVFLYLKVFILFFSFLKKKRFLSWQTVWYLMKCCLVPT